MSQTKKKEIWCKTADAVDPVGVALRKTAEDTTTDKEIHTNTSFIEDETHYYW